MTGRYRVVPISGSDYLGDRIHAVQEGGSGGRIIGEDWSLVRHEAEALAAELEAAFEAGTEANVEA